jgi:predicted MPP superfamily phosphohydrolase
LARKVNREAHLVSSAQLTTETSGAKHATCGDWRHSLQQNLARHFATAVLTGRASADILLLCGDLVDYGLPEEAAILAKELNNLKIPILAVLGNHEFESASRKKSGAFYRTPPPGS